MTRQNFFQGQCVAPEHLNALQDYADSGQANLISGLLGYGVVEGFEVSTVEGYVVEVTSGLAFNLAGERLILDDNKQVDLSQYSPSSVIKLGVVVDYEKSESIVNGYGDTVHTKWTPSVQFIMGETLDSGVFELAEVTIGTTSITSITNTSESFITLQKIVQNTTYMEIGTNGNGTYIKFENGILICLSGSITLSYATSTTRCGYWTFPYAFKTTPNAGCSGVGGANAYHNASIFTECNTTSSLTVVSLTTSSNYWSSARAMAIGFWK